MMNSEASNPRQAISHPEYVDYCDKSNDWIVEQLSGTRSERCIARLQSSFPSKLHVMVERTSMSEQSSVVGWMPHGRAFKVFDRKRFVKEVLPLHFQQQTEFLSFQRQLNIYSFQRITQGPDSGCYYHKYFLRGKVELAMLIPRQPSAPSRVRRSVDPTSEPDFYTLPYLPHSTEGRHLTDTRPSSLVWSSNSVSTNFNFLPSNMVATHRPYATTDRGSFGTSESSNTRANVRPMLHFETSSDPASFNLPITVESPERCLGNAKMNSSLYNPSRKPLSNSDCHGDGRCTSDSCGLKCAATNATVEQASSMRADLRMESDMDLSTGTWTEAGDDTIPSGEDWTEEHCTRLDGYCDLRTPSSHNAETVDMDQIWARQIQAPIRTPAASPKAAGGLSDLDMDVHTYPEFNNGVDTADWMRDTDWDSFW